MATPKVANRYPRPGAPIAPFALRDILMEPIPKRLRDQLGGAELRLCDLDESVWRRFPAEAIGQLAQAVVNCVSTRQALKTLRDRRFPRPLPNLRLDDLRLENRTRRCLIREGLDDRPERLGNYTLGAILSIRAFGPRCLLDLLTALESAQKTAGGGKTRDMISSKLSAELTAEAEKLAASQQTRSIGRDDPRFGRWIRAVDGKAQTAFELAEQLRSRTRDPSDVVYVLEQVRALRATIEIMPKLTLEDELIRIFASSPSTRNREILMGYYGWKDGQTHTLTEIGDRFGITRERVRQICAKLIKKRPGAGTISAPVMDRALALIDQHVPAPSQKIEAELVEKGLTALGISLEVVAAGAKLLNRPLRFKIVKVDQKKSPADRRLKIKAKANLAPGKGKYGKKHEAKGYMAVRPEQVDAVPAIADLAKKEVYFHGLTTIARVERIIARRYPADARLVRQVLMQINALRWLDESAGWFTIQGIAKHGMPKAIDKVLAVAGDVTATKMHEALSRNRRLWKEPLPEKVLLEYCRLMPNVRIEGNRIRCDPPRNWKKVLTGVEAKLIGVLKKHGPLMDRGAMEDLCVAAGMNRFSFHAFVSWSPVIEQFGHSLYGPLGASVTKEQVDNMLAQRRANRASQRVLHDHGIAEDGKVWLRYRLSKAASTYAVITIPAALKKIVRGRFQLLALDGRNIGTLAAKDGRAWGLGAYLRQCGAKFGDQVALTIDLPNRIATVSWKKTPDRSRGKNS
jgi:hypothetical protein